MQFATTLAVLFAAAGCVPVLRDDPPPSLPRDCARGDGHPVSIRLLVRVLRRHGISAEAGRSGCDGAPDSVALVDNLLGKSGDDEDETYAREGAVLCDVEKRLPPYGHEPRVRRTRYRGEEETNVDVFNVLCSVYPSDDPGEPQIARDVHALRELTRVCAAPPQRPRGVRCRHGR